MIEHASFVESPGRYRYDEELTRQIRDAGIIVSPTVYSALQTAAALPGSGAAYNPGDVAAVERLEGRLINTGHFRRLGMKIIGEPIAGRPTRRLTASWTNWTATPKPASPGPRRSGPSPTWARIISAFPKSARSDPGHRADLTLLEGNPLEDLEVLRQPLQVYKSGRLVHERNGGDAV